MMLRSVAIGSPRGVDGDLASASELSQLTPCSGMQLLLPADGNGGSDCDAVVTDGDVRCIRAYLDGLKERGGETDNRRCRILLRKVAATIREEIDDEDCRNRQARDCLIAEEMAAREEAMARAGEEMEARWMEQERILAEECGSECTEDPSDWALQDEVLGDLRAAQQEQDDALMELEAEEAGQREQERIFAEEYKDEDLEALPIWMFHEEFPIYLWEDEQEPDKVLAELQLIEQEEQDEVLAESAVEEACIGEQERIFAEEYKDEDLEALPIWMFHEEFPIYLWEDEQEPDKVLAELQLIEQEEQDEVLAESAVEEACIGEQERIFAEECMNEEVNFMDRLHQHAHHTLMEEEIAEQDEVLAESAVEEACRREQERIFAEECMNEEVNFMDRLHQHAHREHLYEQAQEPLIADEVVIRWVTSEPHERRPLLAEIGWPERKNVLDTLRRRLF